MRWEIRSGGHRFLGAESCGPSKRYADKRLHAIRESLYAGKPPQPKITVTQVAQAADKYLSNSQKTKAYNTYYKADKPALDHFIPWYGNNPLSMVGPQTLFDWRDKLMSDGYGNNTVRMRLRALSAFLSWAAHPHNHYIEQNPFRLLPKKSDLFPKANKPGRYITPNEIEGLLCTMPLPQAKAFYFILQTGLRHDELLRHDWKDVRTAPTGSWDAEVVGKGGKVGMVEIPPNAQAVMGPKKAKGKVFEGSTSTWLGFELRKATKALGIGKVRVHDGRHTWATNYQQRTGNQFDLMARGRWSSIDSVAIYQHIRKMSYPTEYPPFTHYLHIKEKMAALAERAKTAIPRRTNWRPQ